MAAQPVSANTHAEQAYQRGVIADIAATPPCCSDDNDEWEGRRYRFSAEEFEAFVRHGQITELERSRAHRNRLALDPDYHAFFNGFWNYKSSSAKAPGDFCAAAFYRQGQGLILVGPKRSSTYAYLIFYGPGIPRPKTITRIKIHLVQTDEKPQLVEVFNGAMSANPENGILLVAVPNFELLLGGILNKQVFKLYDKRHRNLLTIGWEDGHQARNKLRACVDAR